MLVPWGDRSPSLPAAQSAPRSPTSNGRISCNRSQAARSLTTTAILPQVQSLLADKRGTIHWLTTDTIPPGIEDTWQKPSINAETLAFLL